MLAEHPSTTYFHDVPFFSLDELDLHEVLRSMVRELRKTVDFQWVSMYAFDNRRNVLQEVNLAENNGFNFIEVVKFNSGRGLAAWVAQQKRPVILSSVHRGQRFRSNPVKSFLCCPIICNDVTLGVVTLGHSIPNFFTNSTLTTLLNFFRRYLAEYFIETYS